MYYSPEDIQKARELDLLSYLQQYESQELVHVSGNTYCTREHDSLKISNGKWHWFSRGIGGRSALDYLIKVKDIPFTEAVSIILRQPAEIPSVFQNQPKRSSGRKLLLPELQEGYPSHVVQYLKARGIAGNIIDYCIDHKLLFESKDHHNAVFVGYDADGIARSASLRGTVGTYKAEASGSCKCYSFSICRSAIPTTVHVFESAIDLLSYATLEQHGNRDWQKDALLSLAGVFMQKRECVVPVALRQFLDDHPTIHTVHLHLDNDAIGRGAVKGIVEGLKEKPFEVIDHLPEFGKDLNDQLQWEILQNRRISHER